MTPLPIAFNSFGKDRCCGTWRAASLREESGSTHSSAEDVERPGLDMAASMRSTGGTIAIELDSTNGPIVAG